MLTEELGKCKNTDEKQLQKQIRTLTEKLTGCKGELTEMNNNLQKTDAELAKAKNDLIEANAQNKALIDQCNADLQTAQTDLAAAKTDLTKCNADGQTKDQKITGLEEKIRGFEYQVQHLKDSLERDTKGIIQLRKDLQQAETDLATAKSACGADKLALQQQIDACVEDKKTLNKEIQVNQLQISYLRSELTKAKKATDHEEVLRLEDNQSPYVHWHHIKLTDVYFLKVEGSEEFANYTNKLGESTPFYGMANIKGNPDYYPYQNHFRLYKNMFDQYSADGSLHWHPPNKQSISEIRAYNHHEDTLYILRIGARIQVRTNTTEKVDIFETSPDRVERTVFSIDLIKPEILFRECLPQWAPEAWVIKILFNPVQGSTKLREMGCINYLWPRRDRLSVWVYNGNTSRERHILPDTTFIYQPGYPYVK